MQVVLGIRDAICDAGSPRMLNMLVGFTPCVMCTVLVYCVA